MARADGTDYYIEPDLAALFAAALTQPRRRRGRAQPASAAMTPPSTVSL
jgi:hypothetical protein